MTPTRISAWRDLSCRLADFCKRSDRRHSRSCRPYGLCHSYYSCFDFCQPFKNIKSSLLVGYTDAARSWIWLVGQSSPASGPAWPPPPASSGLRATRWPSGLSLKGFATACHPSLLPLDVQRPTGSCLRLGSKHLLPPSCPPSLLSPSSQPPSRCLRFGGWGSVVREATFLGHGPALGGSSRPRAGQGRWVPWQDGNSRRQHGATLPHFRPPQGP